MYDHSNTIDILYSLIYLGRIQAVRPLLQNIIYCYMQWAISNRSTAPAIFGSI